MTWIRRYARSIREALRGDYQPPLPIVIMVALLFAIVTEAFIAFNLIGADDLYNFYLPIAQGCFDCGFTPWHTPLILWPLSLIPLRLLWTVWTILTVLGLFWASRQMEVNGLLVVFAYPALALVWLGQVDVIILVGLVLALTNPNPYWRGFGLLLMSIKPQISGLVFLLLLFYEWYEHKEWRALIIPGAVFVLSLLIYGYDWPLRWFQERLSMFGAPGHIWSQAARFPEGLVGFLGLFFVRGKRDQATVLLLGTALSMNWFAVYSYPVFMALFIPGFWMVPFSYSWLLLQFFGISPAIFYAGIIPLATLLALIWPGVRQRLGWDQDAKTPRPSADASVSSR
ncbi:MAG: hypothetical protein GYB68_11060, partial [Chloroflexi bacterium]|nr:hypothetical protein [Chloroflexota bacterium]